MRARVPILILCLLAGPAVAQDTMHQHGASAGPMQDAMRQMEHGMAIPSSGDVDVDFARMMIPHHQGAIDMAKAELAGGKDSELRKLAEEIITTQEKEIAFLEQWLAKRGLQP